jgi:hypothetical protein
VGDQIIIGLLRTLAEAIDTIYIYIYIQLPLLTQNTIHQLPSLHLYALGVFLKNYNFKF